MSSALFSYLLGLGDDSLVLGHRLSEWCAHAPTLEEDLALANIALDHLGQAQMLLGFAAETEGKGRTADDLAFFRDASEYRNVQMVEIPFALDFSATIMRQFLFGKFQLLFLPALTGCGEPRLSAFAQKAIKEIQYHVRHVEAWVQRLGNGTDESHRRTKTALLNLEPFIDELFSPPEEEKQLANSLTLPRREALREDWMSSVKSALKSASLELPTSNGGQNSAGGREGVHTEHLPIMLAEMQQVARSFPGAQW